MGDLDVEVLDVKELVRTDVTVTGFDLILSFREQHDKIVGSLIHKSSLFSGDMMQRLAAVFLPTIREGLTVAHWWTFAADPTGCGEGG